MSQLLANEFVRLGHQVSLVTQSPGNHGQTFAYPVMRQPSFSELFRALAWADIFWQNNLSLRTLWPATFIRRPVVVTHQGSYCRRPSGLDFSQRLKHAAVSQHASVAVSKAVANCFKTESAIIPNPYDSEIFRLPSDEADRKLDLLFLGRLVSEKGLDLLLQSLARLKAQQLFPCLTIVGDGPERAALAELATKLELDRQVIFAGPLQGLALARTLQRHKILVVPSRYDEPFGVVALEGIACGCVVIGSNGGGLPEAIGDCGLTFPNGDIERLTERLTRTLLKPEERERFQSKASEHLANFRVARVAERYVDLFQKLL